MQRHFSSVSVSCMQAPHIRGWVGAGKQLHGRMVGSRERRWHEREYLQQETSKICTAATLNYDRSE